MADGENRVIIVDFVKGETREGHVIEPGLTYGGDLSLPPEQGYKQVRISLGSGNILNNNLEEFLSSLTADEIEKLREATKLILELTEKEKK